MKTLTLLRHAKAEADSPDGSDFARSLNDRGRRDAARMGEEMRRLGLRFDRILASPARRVIETLEQVGGLAPTYELRIFNASARQLLDLIWPTDDEVETLMMAGHNPAFEQLAAQLSGNGIEGFPTAALAVIEFPFDRWKDIKIGSGRLTRFVKPKELG